MFNEEPLAIINKEMFREVLFIAKTTKKLLNADGIHRKDV